MGPEPWTPGCCKPGCSTGSRDSSGAGVLKQEQRVAYELRAQPMENRRGTEGGGERDSKDVTGLLYVIWTPSAAAIMPLLLLLVLLVQKFCCCSCESKHHEYAQNAYSAHTPSGVSGFCTMLGVCGVYAYGASRVPGFKVFKSSNDDDYVDDDDDDDEDCKFDRNSAHIVTPLFLFPPLHLHCCCHSCLSR